MQSTRVQGRSFLSLGTCHCRPSAHRTGLDAQPVAAWQRRAEVGHERGLGKRRSGRCRTSGWACHTTSATGCLHSFGTWSAPKEDKSISGKEIIICIGYTNVTKTLCGHYTSLRFRFLSCTADHGIRKHV